MKYRYVNEPPPKPEEVKPLPRDPKLRFGYFYNRQEFLLLQCLTDYALEIM